MVRLCPRRSADSRSRPLSTLWQISTCTRRTDSGRHSNTARDISYVRFAYHGSPGVKEPGVFACYGKSRCGNRASRGRPWPWTYSARGLRFYRSAHRQRYSVLESVRLGVSALLVSYFDPLRSTLSLEL